jgi:outer membrane protein assembly factor BamB
VAAEGTFIYAATGSNITALDAASGALLWQMDVGALPTTRVGTSVTHLALVGDVLLVR